MMILMTGIVSATRPAKICAFWLLDGLAAADRLPTALVEVEQDVIRLGPEKVKNKSGLVLPLVGELLDIIERRRRGACRELAVCLLSDDIRRCFATRRTF